jgi:CCR4-NOT transcription complex subunit 3
MSAQRKLQAEIDRVLKKVAEGVEEFEGIRDKVYDANNHQRDKHELELKKSIKRLQRMRDQIKGWISGNDIKDKRVLVDTRKLIETKMERYRTAERDSKNRTFHPSNNKDDEETTEAKKWLSAAREQLEEQKVKMESEIESLNDEGSQEVMERIITLDCAVERHDFHLTALDRIRVLLENEELKPEQVMAIGEAVDDYVQNNEEIDFYEDDEVYNELGIINEDTGELKEYHAVALSSAPTTASVADSPPKVRKKKGGAGKGGKSSKTAEAADLTLAPSPKISNNASLNAAAKAAAEAAEAAKAAKTTASPVSALPPARKSSSSAPPKPSSSASSSHVSGGSVTKQRGSPATAGLTTAAVAAAGQKRSAQQQQQQAAKGRAASKGPTQAQVAAEAQRRKQEEARQAQAKARALVHTQQQQAKALAQQQAKALAQQKAAQQKAAQQAQQANAQAQQQANAQVQQQKRGAQRGASNSAAAAATAAASSNASNAANAAAAKKGVTATAASQISSGSGAVSSTPTLSPLESSTIGGTALSQLFPQRSSSAPSAQPTAVLTTEEKHYRKLSLLGSMDFMPTTADSERPREYAPSQPCSTPAHFPQTPLANFEDSSMFAKLDNDTLFFIFYYQQGTYQQYLAAKELKLGSWRYHKKYLTWFQRHEPPKEITNEYEQGTYGRFFFFFFFFGCMLLLVPLVVRSSSTLWLCLDAAFV